MTMLPKGMLGGNDEETVKKDRKDCLVFGSGLVSLRGIFMKYICLYSKTTSNN